MKRPTRQKMYQKRRKREKLEDRKKDKSGNTYKYSKRLQNNCHQQNSAVSPSIPSYSQGLQLWWQTYCSAIEFHCQQQNAWQTDAQESYSMLLQKYANEYETSSEEDESEVHHCPDTYEATGNTAEREEYVDEEYIKFLEITHKHQEEMRLKRANDSC